MRFDHRSRRSKGLGVVAIRAPSARLPAGTQNLRSRLCKTARKACNLRWPPDAPMLVSRPSQVEIPAAVAVPNLARFS